MNELKAAYRSMAKELHSDVSGGNDFAMSVLKVARDQALEQAVK